MADFRFELQTLLRYREHQRDQCRQLMSEVLADRERCLAEIQQNQQEREETTAALRADSLTGKINMISLSASRYYLSQLDQNRQQQQFQLHRIDQQLELCRLAVIQADQAVKSLEQLREKRWQLHQAKELKQEEQALAEAWQATSRLPKLG